jgi:release factor glutamine methyltransferase
VAGNARTNEDPFYRSLLGRLSASLAPQRDKPEETPEATLRALWSVAAGNPRSSRGAAHEVKEDLDDEGVARLAGLVEQRISGIPLAHLTGRQHFMGLEFLVGKGALIPRVETEILGRAALGAAKTLADARGSITALDICTGAGTIALAIAVYEPRTTVFASDLAPEAVELARANAKHLGVEDKVDLREGDMFDAFDSVPFLGKIDLVTCNPPYISSARVGLMDPEISRHEPRVAFDGGAFGVTILTRLIHEAPRFLKPDSNLCFEVGLGQGKAIARMLEKAKMYRRIDPLVDGSGEIRGFFARTK